MWYISVFRANLLYNLNANKRNNEGLLSHWSSVFADRHFVRWDELIQFEVLLSAHFLLPDSHHLSVSLPITIYDKKISGQSKLA